MGGTGAFGVQIERAVAQAGKARPIGVPVGIADRGKAVRVAVAVRHEVHDPGGKGEHGGARDKTAEGDQTRVLQPFRDLRLGSRLGEVETVAYEDVGVRLMGTAHYGSPSR